MKNHNKNKTQKNFEKKVQHEKNAIREKVQHEKSIR